MVGIFLQALFDVSLLFFIPVFLIFILLSLWKRRFIYFLIILLSAVNMDLQRPTNVGFGERDLLHSGVVVGEDQREHHAKLLIYIDRLLIDDDTIGYDAAVEYYAYGRDVFLGKRLYIKGKVRPSRFAHRPNVLSGHIVASGVVDHPFGFVFHPIRKFIDRILGESFRDDHYRIASGLTLGGSGRLGRELRTVFSRAGILHILAVSGLHVGFVAVFLGFLLLFIPIDYRLKAFVIMCGLFLYAGVTGFRPSVCRATFMAALLGLAMVLQRNVEHIHIINITAIAFLIASPLLIFDLSAQLSFVAVYGILYLYPKIEARFIARVHSRLLKILLVPMAVSFSAQIFVAPFVIYYFHRLPMYAVFTNAVIIPIASIIIFLLFLSFSAGSLCFALVKIIALPVSLLITVVIALLRFFASMPFSSINLTVSPLITFPCYLLVWAKARKVVIWLIVAIMFVFTLSSLVDCLTVCAVGEGVLITTPGGENILVSGKKHSPQRILLARQGISELDYLIAPSEIFSVARDYVSLPDKMRFMDLSRDDLKIHISNRVTITFRDAVMEFDWVHLKGHHGSGRITYILSNGEEMHTIHGSLYGSIIEQMVLDSKIVFRRIGLLF